MRAASDDLPTHMPSQGLVAKNFRNDRPHWRLLQAFDRRASKGSRLLDLWYKNAVIYSLNVATYKDGNGDGIGDFKGLTEQLDHITQLGVNCLGLLPVYPSPGLDHGYDVTDYYNVAPPLGTSCTSRSPAVLDEVTTKTVVHADAPRMCENDDRGSWSAMAFLSHREKK